MENENLIKSVTKGEVDTVPFGGDVKEIGFSISEWQKAYCINGSYATRNPDGSIRTLTNDYYKDNK